MWRFSSFSFQKKILDIFFFPDCEMFFFNGFGSFFFSFEARCQEFNYVHNIKPHHRSQSIIAQKTFIWSHFYIFRFGAFSISSKRFFFSYFNFLIIERKKWEKKRRNDWNVFYDVFRSDFIVFRFCFSSISRVRESIVKSIFIELDDSSTIFRAPVCANWF